MDEIENRLTGEKATIAYDRMNRRTLMTKSASTSAEPPTPPTAPIEKAKDEKKKKQPKTEGAKTEKGKVPITTSEPPKLKELEQKVLDFLISLDHPATSNEVRDHFNFKLRAPARAIFRKLQKLGYGENRKVGNRYQFFVKGKIYPQKAKPKTEPNVEEMKENK